MAFRENALISHALALLGATALIAGLAAPHTARAESFGERIESGLEENLKTDLEDEFTVKDNLSGNTMVLPEVALPGLKGAKSGDPDKTKKKAVKKKPAAGPKKKAGKKKPAAGPKKKAGKKKPAAGQKRKAGAAAKRGRPAAKTGSAAVNRQYREWDRQVLEAEKARRRPVPRRRPAYRAASRTQAPVPLPSARLSEQAMERALTAPPRGYDGRRYSMSEVLGDHRLRARLRRVDISTINFRFDDIRVPPGEIYKLRRIARVLNRIIFRRPFEVFLIEGHTDAVGDYDYNLDLSEDRARAIKAALVEHFAVPAENLVTRGYGERFLLVNTYGRERLNRRVTVRRITPLVYAERGPYRYERPYAYRRPYRPYRRYFHYYGNRY